jgi:hypothetical protein
MSDKIAVPKYERDSLPVVVHSDINPSLAGNFRIARNPPTTRQPSMCVGDFLVAIRESPSEDAPYTRCNYFQQMAVGVAEVKCLATVFPSFP